MVEMSKEPAPKLEPAHTFLQESVDVMVARAALRDSGGGGERSMAKIVATFNAMTGHTLTEADGWKFMVILKLVRAGQGFYDRDSFVDAAAYCGLLGECESVAKPRKN